MRSAVSMWNARWLRPGAPIVAVAGEAGGLLEDGVGGTEFPAAVVVPASVEGAAEVFEEPPPVLDGAVVQPDLDVVEGAGYRLLSDTENADGYGTEDADERGRNTALGAIPTGLLPVSVAS
ncbi:hypothetical protein [Streptomyces sp. NPDC002403]